MLGPYIIPLLEQRKRNWYKHDINWCLSPQLRTRVLKPMFLAVSNLSLGFAKAAASTNPLLIASTSWIHFIPSISSQNPEFDSSLSMFHLYQTFYCQRCWSLNSHNFPHQKSTHTHTHTSPPKKVRVSGLPYLNDGIFYTNLSRIFFHRAVQRLPTGPNGRLSGATPAAYPQYRWFQGFPRTCWKPKNQQNWKKVAHVKKCPSVVDIYLHLYVSVLWKLLASLLFWRTKRRN